MAQFGSDVSIGDTPTAGNSAINGKKKVDYPNWSNDDVFNKQMSGFFDEAKRHYLSPHGSMGSMNDMREAMDNGKMTGREFYQRTGRINAKATKDPAGGGLHSSGLTTSGLTTSKLKSGGNATSGGPTSNDTWVKTFRDTNVKPDSEGVAYQPMNGTQPFTGGMVPSQPLNAANRVNSDRLSMEEKMNMPMSRETFKKTPYGTVSISSGNPNRNSAEDFMKKITS